MKRKPEFWMAHVAALKDERISASTYAKRHGLAVKSLYRWQRKLNATAGAAASASHGGAFVALRVAEPVVSQTVSGCALILGSGMRLEMPVLPAPAWRAALGRAVQGER